MSERALAWILINVVIVTLLVLDLAVFHRKSHVIGFREALGWAGFWVALAVVFGGVLYFWMGPQPALEYFTGFLIEKSLSVDNLFVFLLIFSYFQVPRAYQYKVLFWGILGALVFRALFILTGVVLIQRFHWIIYIFGAFLVYSGIKMARQHGAEVHPERNPVLRLFRRWMPVTADYEKDRFFVHRGGQWFATPMFVVLLVVETTDVVFAVDSIPAILAITKDPFLVYTSNAFAILGLRSLYFALAGLMALFRYLHYGLSAILVFVGVKMMAEGFDVHIPTLVALGVVAALMAASVLASLLHPAKNVPEPAPEGHEGGPKE
jgi:tellurite resistance protein TerC